MFLKKYLMKNIFLIFGITGDLSRRKLIPALYHLIASGKLANTKIIGAAIEDLSKEQVLHAAKPFISNLDLTIWQKLNEKFTYFKVDINQQDDFVVLADFIKNEQVKFNLDDQILVYCAVFELLYPRLTKQLSQVGIIKRMIPNAKSWCRVVYEKPFGHSYESVHALNQAILNHLNEEQVFRVDHYLAKEIVSNIAFVRFSNRIFEQLWNYTNIDQVQIILDEAIDIENRAAYYERYGVIKDMVQNHALQLMSLVAMDAPKSLSGSDIQDAKSKILQKISCLDGIFGQYQGYLQEPNVDSKSRIATFAALKFKIDDHRWQGVSFYVRTGKVLREKITKIVIVFKNTQFNTNFEHQANRLTISIYPTGGFNLEVNAKKIGADDQVVPVNMSGCYDCIFVPQAPNAYQNVIEQIMQGQTNFAVRLDEIEQAWRISDQIEKLNLPLYQYGRQTNGPKELIDFNQINKLDW
jgi:glucose-6-phosphate 1-dehydrogenase